MAEKIMLLDGNSLMNRAFYAMPLLTNKEGTFTNGVYGFLNIFLNCLMKKNLIIAQCALMFISQHSDT